MSRRIAPHALKTALTLLTLGALLRTPARCQAPPESPEDVAQQYAAALRDTNWLRMASLMHPTAIAQVRSLFAPVLNCGASDIGPVRQSLFGASSAAELARMSDTLLIAHLLRFASTRQEGVAAFLRTAQMRILGHVAEGPDTVHVLTRITFTVEGTPVSVMDVAPFQRYDSTWRMLLKADFSAIAAMLRNVCNAGS